MGLFNDEKSAREIRGGFKPAESVHQGTKRRVIDEEAGVVIWVVKYSDGYGMTSLPIEQTDLTIDDN